MFNGLEIMGIAILAGFAGGKAMELLKVPSVAGYVIVGVLLGGSATGVFSHADLGHMGVVGDLALGVIAFSIGGELEGRTLRRLARALFPIVLLEALGAMLAVTLGVWAWTADLPLALVLGAISAATAPAATVMVIRELRASGILTRTLMAVVGIDDAIALVLYALAAALAKAMLSGGAVWSLEAVAGVAGLEIGGSLLLGGAVALAVGPLLARLPGREASLSVAIGALVGIAGVAEQTGISPLLANMAFGAVLVNVSPISTKALVEQVSTLGAPILIGFFVLAGAHLRLDLLPSLGVLGVVYLFARIFGKVMGASLGAWLSRAPQVVRRNIGYGLLSQVGIAIGLSLVVANEFAQFGAEGRNLALTVINVLLATTVVTEVVGPILTRRALLRAGEAGGMDSDTQGDSR